MTLPGAEVFERAGLRAWPGIEVEWDGGWVRRAANGYTKRANSVQSLDPCDDHDAASRLTASLDWFKARGLPPVFRVTPLTGPRILEALDTAGWETVDDSYLFAMTLKPFEPDPRCQLVDPLDPQFLTAQQHLQNYSDEQREHLRALLDVIDVPARGVILYSEDGKPRASSFMAVADGIVITGNVVTDRTQRRMGYGGAMMRSGLSWATSAGATIAALNVGRENAAGHALYGSLGYQRQYDYTYRIPPQS